MPSVSIKAFLIVGLKIGITLGAIYLLSKRVNLAQLLDFQVENWSALVCGLLVALMVVLLQALRWRQLAYAMSFVVSVRQALTAVWFGHFLNNVLPTSTAGDVVRNFTLKYEEGEPGRWIGVLVSEKFAAMLTALLTAAVVSPLSALDRIPMAVKITVFAVIIGMVSGYALLRLVHRYQIPFLSHRLRTYLSAITCSIGSLYGTRNGRQALLLSFIVNLCMATFFLLAAYALNVSLSIEECLFVVPVFSVIAALPISYGGWGVRELSGVQLLSFLNVDSHLALTVTVLYGVINLVSCFPGALLGRHFLRRTRLQRSSYKEALRL